MTSESVFFHEDERGQIELLPASARAFCEGELVTIGRLAREHPSEDGLGWTEHYLRREPPVGLAQAGLTAGDVGGALGPAWSRVGRVTTGLLSHPSVVESTEAFVLGENCVVFAVLGEEALLEGAWLRLKRLEPDQVDSLRAGFAGLASRAGVILMDWTRRAITDLGQADDVEAYLRRRATRRLSS